MMYFLVQATICHTPYMGDDRKFDDIRLVLAVDETDAQRKYEAYWDGKTEQYGDSYWIISCEVRETIT